MRVFRPVAVAASFTTLCLVAACSMVEPEPIEPPIVNLRSLEPEVFGITGQTLRARLGLFNPNTVPLEVERGSLELQLDGVRAAKGRTLAAFSIPPGERTEVDVRVTMNLLRDAPALFAILSAPPKADGIGYQLDGFIDVRRCGRDRLPINAAGRLSLGSLLAPSPPREAAP